MQGLCKAIFLFLAMPFMAIAQDATVFKPDSIRKSIHAIRIDGSLKVDGQFKEQEWRQTKPSPSFVMIEPFQGNKPNHPTDVRVLYNKQFLYVGIFARDTMGKKALRATDFKRDFNFLSHDMVSLAFDGFNDKRNAMAFSMNPYGVQRDLLAFDDMYYDIDWDGLWRVRTNRTDSGWHAEVAIPWQTLRYPRKDGQQQNWGFNVYRNRRLSNETSAFSVYPRSFTVLRMEYAGELQGLQPPPPKPNVRIQPYLLSNTNTEREKGRNKTTQTD
ncbi:MAG: hypothetical protein EAZ80_13545, partial [Runella slithyformis]